MPYTKKVGTPVVSAAESAFFVCLQLVFAGLIIYGWFPQWFHQPPVPPGYAVTVLAIGAAAMSVNEHMGRWKKAAWLLMLALLASIEVRAISTDRKKQDEQFAQTLGTITGGDSFVYLSLRPLGVTTDLIDPVLMQNGPNPIRDVKIQISLLFVDSGTAPDAPLLLSLPARDVAVNEKTPLIEFPLHSLGRRMFYIIHFDALNGHWSQRVVLRRLGDKWVEATEVMRPDETSISRTIFQQSDPDFPTVNGKPDWGTPAI